MIPEDGVTEEKLDPDRMEATYITGFGNEGLHIREKIVALIAKVRRAERARTQRQMRMVLWPFAHAAEFVPPEPNAYVIPIPHGRYQLRSEAFFDAKKTYDSLLAEEKRG